MDELELLQRNRPLPTPTDDVVARHRAALRAAIAADARDGTAPELELAAGSTRRHRPLLGVAAAVALVAIGVGVVALAAGDDPRTTTDTTAPSVTAASAGECGPLPFALPLPPGFAEPTAGPSGDGPGPSGAGQLVVHSTSSSGSIEVRWPSGAESSFVLDRGDDPGVSGMSWTTSEQPQATATGRHAFSMEVHDPQLSPEPQCQAMRFVVADADTETARRLAGELFRALGEPGAGPFGGPVVPLVTGHETADAAPSVPPCNAPAGVDHVDRIGGQVDLGTAPTPEGALAAFVESKMVDDIGPFGLPLRRATVVDRGYVETTLPDGRIAYVARIELGVTVVHVAPVEGGWAVDRWEATGC